MRFILELSCSLILAVQFFSMDTVSLIMLMVELQVRHAASRSLSATQYKRHLGTAGVVYAGAGCLMRLSLH